MSDTAWFSDLEHRLVILVSLLIVFQRAIVPNDQDVLRDCNFYMTHTMNQIKRLARDVIRLSHPKEAKAVVEVYLRALMDEGGSDLHSVDGQTWEELMDLNDRKLLDPRELYFTGGNDEKIWVPMKKT